MKLAAFPVNPYSLQEIVWTVQMNQSLKSLENPGERRKRTMHIDIHDPALEARIQKQIHATGSASAEEAAHLLETREEQDRWLLG